VWVLLALLVATLVLFTYALPYLVFTMMDADDVRVNGRPMTAQELRALLLPQRFVVQGLASLAGMGVALALILGVLATGSEYRWGTVRTLVTHGPSRLAVGGGKTVGLALVLACFVLVSMAVALASSVVVAARAGAPVTLPSAGTVAAGLGAGWLILFSWSAFGTFLALAARGTGLAIGLGLVYLFVIESLAAALPLPLGVATALRQALLGANSQALALSFGPWAGFAATPAWQSALVLAGYGALFLILAGIIFQRRDIT
jgi:ABC-type transport system involved in multi-copper enzyme maturation permease subunit